MATAESVPLLVTTLSTDPRVTVASSYDSFTLSLPDFGLARSQMPPAAVIRTTATTQIHFLMCIYKQDSCQDRDADFRGNTGIVVCHRKRVRRICAHHLLSEQVVRGGPCSFQR